MASFQFKLLKQDPSSKARAGLIQTAHGPIETPAFMAVGTRGTVKTLTHQHLHDLKAPIILGNTYHLMLRPGQEILNKAGGLHSFIGWDRPILTDSGGYQVFSLSSLNKIDDRGVTFQSHIDGKKHFLGPQESMSLQKTFGSDIVMAFDECSPYPCDYEIARKALRRTLNWAKICRDYPLQEHQALFGIVQGGTYEDLPLESLQTLNELPFEGYAIGGLAVGEPAAVMNSLIDLCTEKLPQEKPRYLMGVGTPRNLIEAVLRGVDMFDCVLPTRNARNGTAFTWEGKIQIKASRYKEDFTPLDAQTQSYTSQFSKAYIRHLLNVEETSGSTLVTIQNLAFYLDFMSKIRQSIREGSLWDMYQKVCALYPN